MKKGQILEGQIQKVIFPNKGIVKVEGEEKQVIVKNGIAGQKVRFPSTRSGREKVRDVFWKYLKRHLERWSRPVSISGNAGLYLPEFIV